MKKIELVADFALARGKKTRMTKKKRKKRKRRKHPI